ncbi:MAG: hypothetical protein LBI53_00080 [Candidatus Peribacteria bacterium]|jgi:hypothetical protein|nr:hypothetical protein [Candidatus Peribacteria bacterium]
MDEVLQLGEIGTIGAIKDLPATLSSLYKNKLTTHKGLTGIKKGDIIISTSGAYGHVGIYIDTLSTGKLDVFNQN